MTEITTHVLDTARGRPAAGVPVSLHSRQPDGSWAELGGATTDGSGRTSSLGGDEGVKAGLYRLVFDAAAYLRAAFFDEVVVTFRVTDEDRLHIPLLLSPYGYSVYRGS